MDFPDKSFPYQLYKPSKKREVFLSYGSHDNIDVYNITEKQFYPQKIPEGFLNKKISLKPCRPTLPLHEEPQISKHCHLFAMSYARSKPKIFNLFPSPFNRKVEIQLAFG